MAKNTKKRILEVALKLFAQEGYKGTSMNAIALELGITKAALYRHYKSKRDIFDSIVSEMQKRYEEYMSSMDLHLGNAEEDVPLFRGLTEDELVKKVCELIEYAVHDEYVSRFRKILILEQFHDPEMAQTFTERYIDRLVNYHENLFRQMTRIELLNQIDCHIMALQYVAPVVMMIQLCDRQPEQEKYALAEIERHVRQFYKMYSM